MRQCSGCKEWKNNDEFYYKNRHWCKKCFDRRNRLWREEHPEETKANRRAYHKEHLKEENRRNEEYRLNHFIMHNFSLGAQEEEHQKN